MRNRPTTVQRVREWIEAGQVGTIPEIAEACGSNWSAVKYAVSVLVEQGAAERVSVNPLQYGPRPADDCGPLVQRALMRRTALERVWAGWGA